MRAVLRNTADEIDANPDDVDHAHRLALRVRYAVDLAITEISHRLTTALGPGPFAHQADLHRHLVETDLYRRQSHGERDLQVLGELVQNDDVTSQIYSAVATSFAAKVMHVEGRNGS